MEIVTKSISELSPDPNNARKHDKRNLEAIKGSLRKFGQQHPIIVDDQGVVLAGNGRLEAAKELGWTEINCVVSDLESVTAKTAFSLADNRTAELASWDDDILGAHLQALQEDGFGIAEIGFDYDEFGIENPTKEGLTDDDEIPDVEENIHGVARGDIWLLGSHRLMCGDSVNADDVAALMAGEKADMVFTDPPYRVSFEGQRISNTTKDGKKIHGHKGANTKHDAIANDALSEDDFAKFMQSVLVNLWSFNAGAWYICFAYSELHLLLNSIAVTNQKWKNILIWMKNQATLSNMDYKSRYEPIVYGQPGGKFYGERYLQEDIWQFQRTLKNDLHPTMKPIELIENALKNSSKDGMKVLDLFLGSGSTLIACEKTNRRCYGMEIDPHYCSVIIERWQKFTGKTAELVTNDKSGT